MNPKTCEQCAFVHESWVPCAGKSFRTPNFKVWTVYVGEAITLSDGKYEVLGFYGRKIMIRSATSNEIFELKGAELRNY